MVIELPELALVVLIGPSGAGKSTFARAHFRPTEVLSSDFCRGLVSDDENDQSATNDAFELLHAIAAKRLARRRLTVVDATNVKPADRKPLINLARDYHVLPVAIVLNLPARICNERNQERPDRNFGSHVVRRQLGALKRSLRSLKREGFRRVFILNSEADLAAVTVERRPLWNDLRHEHGPFDLIGDVHGCGDELEQLLADLGYEWTKLEDDGRFTYRRLYRHPFGRKAIFLGDLVDRGPRSLDAYQLVRHMVEAGAALCVPGNHDVRLMRRLTGRKVKVRFGLAQTLAEVESLPETMRDRFTVEMVEFIRSLVSHYVLDSGKLVVAHAGMKEELQGRASGRVREFALYGETSGETDEFGLPIRYNWALDYRGRAMVVYGHTPVPHADWLNGTINIDTGCVFGGRLTALRYPEREFVSVPAGRTYAVPIRPLQATGEGPTAQQAHDDVLDIEDVTGKRLITTRLYRNIMIQAENGAAALEVMSRFAVNPKWLIYLPPTMAPTETSQEPDLLEHPAEAFDYYRQNGVEQVICQEKHMGSRAVVIVTRNDEVVRQRFGITGESLGIIYTRTGRRFFGRLEVEHALLEQLRQALTQAAFWQEFESDWVCLDCELMPWSNKAQALLEQQYAAVGAAARAALAEALVQLDQVAARSIDVTDLRARFQDRARMADRFVDAYRHYCWPVHDVSDLRLAPFHVLATETAVHSARTHQWHMETIARIVAAQPQSCLMTTAHHAVTLDDPASTASACNWWRQLTEQGGEGLVIKPTDFAVTGRKGLVQPAIKCRGREYLRIIYGPEYTAPSQLSALRRRHVARKRSLALREFALGLEALERFVRREPLRAVHQCVFGVLALESEPIDPRL